MVFLDVVTVWQWLAATLRLLHHVAAELDGDWNRRKLRAAGDFPDGGGGEIRTHG